MKIRVTLMTENDKHCGLPKEKIEEVARGAWEMFLCMLNRDNDRNFVEKIEVIED